MTTVHTLLPVHCSRLWLALALLLATAATRPSVYGQTWEYSPYRIHLWVAVGRQGEWDDQELQRLQTSLEQRAERAVDSAWELIVTPPPTEQLRTDLLHDPELVTADRIVETLGEADPTDAGHLLNDDKLVCVSISSEPEGYVVRARELDLRMRYFGPQVEYITPSRMLVHSLVFDALSQVFSPVIRIETSEPRQATARIRAGGLVLRKDSPAAVDERSVLVPLIRRNERSGRPKQITLVDWTFLTVEKKDGSVLDCKIHSTWNNPLGGRSSMRIQKLALGVKPVAEQGTLELVSQEEGVPLEGYEIFAKDPFVEDAEAERLGITDWRGRLEVPRSDRLLRILYVTNGGVNLVRLPMAPGYNLLSRTEMPNDEVRLEAESFIRGIQVELIDLVARREILSQRIRKRLEDGELDEAGKLLNDFRKLTTSTELLERMDQKRGSLASNNRRTRSRIEAMFLGTRELIAKHANLSLGEQLTAEVSRAGGGGGASAAPPSETAPAESAPAEAAPAEAAPAAE